MPANTPPPVPASTPGNPNWLLPEEPAAPIYANIISSGPPRPWRTIKRDKRCKHCGREHKTAVFQCVKCGQSLCDSSVTRSDQHGLIHADSHCCGKVIRVVLNPVSKIVIVGG
jgi:hypothetical protein